MSNQLQPPKGCGLKQGTPKGGSQAQSEVTIVGTLFQFLCGYVLYNNLICDIAR